MSGVKGRSGRRKCPDVLVKEYLDKKLPEQIPAMLDKMIEMALAGDKDLLIYCSDRYLGRPKISVDNRMSVSVGISPDDRRQALLEARATEVELLSGPKEVIIDGEFGQSDNQKSDTV
jgi:hypothetical protein